MAKFFTFPAVRTALGYAWLAVLCCLCPVLALVELCGDDGDDD